MNLIPVMKKKEKKRRLSTSPLASVKCFVPLPALSRRIALTRRRQRQSQLNLKTIQQPKFQFLLRDDRVYRRVFSRSSVFSVFICFLLFFFLSVRVRKVETRVNVSTPSHARALIDTRTMRAGRQLCTHWKSLLV